jgi:hypothetical protein
MGIIWDVAPCSLVETDQPFRGAFASITTLMIEAVSSAELLVSIYQTIWLNTCEGSHFHTIPRENVKSLTWPSEASVTVLKERKFLATRNFSV